MRIQTRIHWLLLFAFTITICFGIVWVLQFLQVSTSLHTYVIDELSTAEEVLRENQVSVSIASAQEATEQMRHSLKKTMTVTTVLLGAIFLFLSLLFFELYRSVIVPIVRMRKDYEIIGRGDLSHRVEYHSEDEIGDLAKEMNALTEHLSESQQEVKKEQQKLIVSLQESEEQKMFLEDVRKAMINLLEDIEEEKTNAIRHAQKSEVILKSMDEGVCVVDLSGKIQFMNSAGKTILGREKQKVVGKHVSRMLKAVQGEKKVSASKLPIMLCMKKGKALKGPSDLLFTSKSGSRVAVESVASPLTIDQKVEGAVLMFRDVTRAREVDRTKSEFISIVSHQLRTPLTALRWHNEMILAGNLGEISEKQNTSFKKMYGSILRMVALVNAMLNVARIEAGRIEIEPVPTDLARVAEGVLGKYETQIKDKSLEVATDIDVSIGEINVDPCLIEEVFSNLVSNAIKYSLEKGGVSLSLKSDGDMVKGKISDTGLGIPKEQQDKVFTKFFRGENILSEDTDGTGLGLYIVKAIIESSGGKIWFESEENNGTTFWFTLPKSGMMKRSGDRKIVPLETSWGHSHQKKQS